MPYLDLRKEQIVLYVCVKGGLIISFWIAHRVVIRSQFMDRANCMSAKFFAIVRMPCIANFTMPMRCIPKCP